jgi:hypothetical protein
MIKFALMMKNKAYLVLLSIVVLMSGCEDNMVLRSSKKMKDELQGTWKRNHLGVIPFFACNTGGGNSINYYFQEYWIFKGDRLFTVYNFTTAPSCGSTYPDIGTKDLSIDTIGTNQFVHFDKTDTNIVASFDVDANVFRAFLSLEFISGNNDTIISDNNLVPEWEFVELEDNRLYIAADNETGTSVLQKEFYKIK